MPYINTSKKAQSRADMLKNELVALVQQVLLDNNQADTDTARRRVIAKVCNWPHELLTKNEQKVWDFMFGSK